SPVRCQASGRPSLVHGPAPLARIMVRRRPDATLFPYATLFRSLLYIKKTTIHRRGKSESGRNMDDAHRRWIRLPHTKPMSIVHVDRKSTRLNSSHVSTAYAGFCLKNETAGGQAQHHRRAAHEGE